MERHGRATAGISGHVDLIKRERGSPHAILTDARQLPRAVTTGATFADAAAESLRCVEPDRVHRVPADGAAERLSRAAEWPGIVRRWRGEK